MTLTEPTTENPPPAEPALADRETVQTGKMPHPDRPALLQTALSLQGSGLHLLPVGTDKKTHLREGYQATHTPAEWTANAVTQVRDGRCCGIAAVLGSHGIRPDPAVEGGWLVPLALELEGKATESLGWMSEWASAIERVGVADLKLALDAGWREHTPSGGERWFFDVQLGPELAADLPSCEEYLGWYLHRLPARKAMRGQHPYAELLHSKAIVAPSAGATHPTGGPYTLISGGADSRPVLQLDDLLALGILLAEVSDVTPAPPGDATARVVPERTRAAAYWYNARVASTKSTVSLMVDNGWTVNRTTSNGTVELTRPGRAERGTSAVVGGPGRYAGNAFVYTSGDSKLAQDQHGAFDVLAILAYEGDRDQCAEKLISSGVVRVPVQVLFAKTRPDIHVEGMRTDVLVNLIGTAMADATHPNISGVPFVLAAQTPAGLPLYPVTVRSDGGVQRWQTKEDHVKLALAVVQPMRVSAGGVTSYQHELTATVSSLAVEAARESAMRPVKYISPSPVLTEVGIASKPGYDPEMQALVSIPRREQAWWKDGYRVDPHPSQSAAQKAADFIEREVLHDFCFRSPADKARGLAYLLTCAGRSLFPTAMGFLFDATNRGSGKDLLAQVGRTLGSGTSAYQALVPDAKYGGDAENTKAIVAAALAGTRHAHISEIPRGESITSLKLSEWMCALDGSHIQRILGGNTSTPLSGFIWTACGNNITAGNDHNRRWLPVQLHYEGGIAYERSGFRHPDLPAWVSANRPELLAALHTILLHELQNPKLDVPLLGSFEGFCQVIFGALSHITLEGKKGQENGMDLARRGLSAWQEGNDENVEEWADFLTWWSEHLGDAFIEVKALYRAVEKANNGSLYIPADLTDALHGTSSEVRMIRQWSHAFKSILGTAIPTIDYIYRIERVEQGRRAALVRVTAAPRENPPATVEEVEKPTKKRAPRTPAPKAAPVNTTDAAPKPTKKKAPPRATSTSAPAQKTAPVAATTTDEEDIEVTQ